MILLPKTLTFLGKVYWAYQINIGTLMGTFFYVYYYNNHTLIPTYNP